MDVEEENVTVWKLEEFIPELEFKKKLKSLEVLKSPFRWNPRDGIFAHARELPPSIDIADMLDGIERAPSLKHVKYPIKTLHWRIMVLIGACYEYVHMKEYLKARRRLMKLIKLLGELKQSRKAYSLKYHTAFSYIAYALLTIRDETEPEDQSVDEPSPGCSSTPDVQTSIPLKKELPTDPKDCDIPVEIRYAIYEYGALFFKRYGLKGLERAEQYLSTVIDEREPKEAWWYFERAKILARKRGSVAAWKLPTPTSEEFEDIDAAVRTKAHPFYQLHFAELKGQMCTWDSTDAALEAYISFGNNNRTNSPDLLCKCVEGILDLIRARDHGFLIENVKKFLGRKDTFEKMIDAALHVLYLATQSKYKCNADMVNRCYGHIYLLEESRNSKEIGIKYLKKCVTHTYDSAFELIRLEQSDRCKELLYLLMQTQTNRAVKTFFAREVIMHFLFSLKNLKSAVGTALICLQNRTRIADIKMVYNPRLLYLKTRHGIDCVDVLEWKIKQDRNSKLFRFLDPYRTFSDLLRKQRRSIYGETGPQVNFDDLNEYISLTPIKPRKYNHHPDVTGSTYISRKVGALPVIYSPVSESLPLSYRGGGSGFPGITAIRKARARLTRGKKAFIEIAKTIHRHFNTPAVETLATIENRATPIDPCTLALLREEYLVPEGDTQTEELSEISQGQRPEHLEALKFRPQTRYYRIERSGVLIPYYDSDGSISETSISSSDDEADAGKVSRQGRKAPSSAKSGTARTSSAASPQSTSLPGSESLGQEGVFVKMKTKIPRMIITQPEESDSEESSENLVSQRNRPSPGQRMDIQWPDSDTSSVQPFKVVLTEETPDEEMPDAGQENLPLHKKHKLAGGQQEQVGYTETQSVPATPAQGHPTGFLLVKQSGTSDLSHPTEKSTPYPTADTAKAFEMLSIVSTQSASSVEGSDVQVASDEGAATWTGFVRQAPATDKKSSPQAMELEGDEEGTSTEKRDDTP